MVLGRNLVWQDELRKDFPRYSRPKIKIPCVVCNPHLDSNGDSSRLSPVSSSSSTRSFGNVLLSTPSPSALANGYRVDKEIAKFRKLSNDCLRQRSVDLDNYIIRTRSRSPSPPVGILHTTYYRRSSSQPSESSWSGSVSGSPRSSPERHSPPIPFPRISSSPRRSFRSKSPSPILYSPDTQTFFRSNSLDRNIRFGSPPSNSPSPRINILPPSILRKTSKYDQKFNSLPSRSFSFLADQHPPVACRYRRASSLEDDDEFFEKYRSRSVSPLRLKPASRNYRKNGSFERNYINWDSIARSSEQRPTQSSKQKDFRMSSPRRFSEESMLFRKPLATLHEDEIVARRRFSDGPRKKSYDTSDVLRDVYDYDRKLSEAGVRKHSDTTAILTEDTDSFIIGDRVWVGGTKPGSISFIGETQFAPGEWAGITLDEAIGKNDGMVGGVRYFQCEPRKGIFSRLTRLSRVPLSDRDIEIMSSKTSSRVFDTSRAEDQPDRKSSLTDSVRKVSGLSDSGRKTSAGSNSFSKSGSPIPSNLVRRNLGPSSGAAIPPDMRIGDRVVIDSQSGTKYGAVKFLGRTEFANGNWAGVELDEPTGKNDGSVAGKKYFVCRMNYGLFAPINRVRRVLNRSSVPRSSVTPGRRSMSPESVGGSSVSSNVSSLKGTRRIGSRTSSISATPSTKALQETLKEKTEHVDQLMRERDIERGDLANLTSELEESNRMVRNLQIQMNQFQIESEERLHDLGEKVEALETERKELTSQVELKQKEIDDLNFQIEEETLAKAEFQNQDIENSERVKELEKELEEGRKKLMQQSLEGGALRGDSSAEMEKSLTQNIEDLEAKSIQFERDKVQNEKTIEELQTKIKDLETVNFSLQNSLTEEKQKNRLMGDSISSENQKRIDDLEAKIKELEDQIDQRQKESEDVSQQAEEFLTDLKTARKDAAAKDEEINELKKQLNERSKGDGKSEEELKKLRSELQSLREESDSSRQKMEQQIEEASAKLKEMNSKFEEKESEFQKLSLELQTKEAQISNITRELETERASLASTAVLLKKTQEEEAKTEENVKRLENLTQELQEKLTESERSSQSLSLANGDLSRQIADAKQETAEILDSREKLEKRLQESLSTSSSVDSQIESLHSQLKEANDKAEKAVKSERELASQLCSEKEKNEEARKNGAKEVESLNHQLEEERKKFLELSKELEDGKTVIEMVQDESEKLRKELADISEEKLKVEDELKTQLSSREAEVATMKKEFEEKVATLSSQNETERTKGQDQMGQLTTQVESLTAQLKTYEEKLKEQIALAQSDQEGAMVLKEELNENKNELGRLEERLNQVRTENEKLKGSNVDLSGQVTQLKALQNESETAKQDLKAQLEAKISENVNLVMEVEQLKTTSNDELLKFKEQNDTLTSELQRGSALQTDNQKLQEELAGLNKEKEELKSKCDALQSTLSSDNSNQESKLTEFEEKQLQLRKEVEDWSAKHQVLSKENQQLQEKLEKCDSKIQSLETELASQVESAETKNSDLDNLKQEYERKQKDEEAHKQNLIEEVTSLQDKVSELKSAQEASKCAKEEDERDSRIRVAEKELAEYKLKCLALDSEKRRNEEQIKTLQEQVILFQSGPAGQNEAVVKIKEERDQYEGQVNFLNSVIVDMQRKKEELEVRLEAMSMGNVPDDEKANLNGLNQTRTVIPPRLFCDICDCFDLHDTEDCPQQASGETDLPPPSHHGADRHAPQRPYCDSCEVFGHADGECPDETF